MSRLLVWTEEADEDGPKQIIAFSGPCKAMLIELSTAVIFPGGALWNLFGTV
jgi:hypothetical protein